MAPPAGRPVSLPAAAPRAPGRGVGRPRTRPRPDDFPDRLDANAVRRQAIDAGHPLDNLPSVTVEYDRGGGLIRAVRVAVVSEPDWIYGRRLRFLCPRCGRPAQHLYHADLAPVCRRCRGIGYRRG